MRPIQQFAYSSGKNATDIALVIDALNLLYTQPIDAFGVASSDGDFTPLVQHLREAGKSVYGFGKANTPEAFQTACTTFFVLETLGETGEDTAAALVPGKSTSRLAKAAVPIVTAKSTKSLSQDAKLVETLRGAVKASAGEDGWARLSAAGSAAKRIGSIDPQNYGFGTFTKLFQATGLFDVIRGKDGQLFLADGRNKDRADKPAD